MTIPHVTYNGESKVIRRLCEIVNGIIDAGTDVTVTPQLNQGTPVAKIAVDGTEHQIYAPYTQFDEDDDHPLDGIAVNPDWAYWNNGYCYTYGKNGGLGLQVRTPLFPPILFTDQQGYVCAAYDDNRKEDFID